MRNPWARYVSLGPLIIIVFMCLICRSEDRPPSSDATDAFQREMELSRTAPDRDSKVEHLRLALQARPGHRDNVDAEFQIAVLLSQYFDPAHPQPVKRREAVAVYQHILATYKHMDYYSVAPVIASSEMQLMMPQAAIHLACLYRGLDGDNEGAKQRTHFAMQCLADTYERRKNDWLNAPAPRPPAGMPEDLPEPEKSRLEAGTKRWTERREKAAQGEVFGELETAIAEAAVRQYGFAFGKVTLGEVPIPMGQVTRDFPGTPMATIAERHIARAKELMQKGLLAELPAESHLGPEPPPDASRPLSGPRVDAAPEATLAAAEPNQSGKTLATAEKSTVLLPVVLPVSLALVLVLAAWVVMRRKKLKAG